MACTSVPTYTFTASPAVRASVVLALLLCPDDLRTALATPYGSAASVAEGASPLFRSFDPDHGFLNYPTGLQDPDIPAEDKVRQGHVLGAWGRVALLL